MISFLLAIQFLSILPLKIKDFSEQKLAWALVYFPVAGLFLGAVLVGLNTLLSALGIPGLVVNIILVVGLIVLTGGMHLDGLTDTADAFLSGKGKDEMLAIMRDPHIGVMGALSLISIILLKIGLLSALSPAMKPAALVLMCLLSRWSSVMAMYLFPYARQEGKAKLFMQGLNLKIFIASLILALLFSFTLLGSSGLVALAVIAGCTYLFGKFSGRRIGGITGDTLGATIELMEVVTLLTVCIVERLIWMN